MCVRSSKKNSNSKQKSDIIIEITSKEKANKEANISKPSKVRKAEEESERTNKINANKKERKEQNSKRWCVLFVVIIIYHYHC